MLVGHFIDKVLLSPKALTSLLFIWINSELEGLLWQPNTQREREAPHLPSPHSTQTQGRVAAFSPSNSRSNLDLGGQDDVCGAFHKKLFNREDYSHLNEKQHTYIYEHKSCNLQKDNWKKRGVRYICGEAPKHLEECKHHLATVYQTAQLCLVNSILGSKVFSTYSSSEERG